MALPARKEGSNVTEYRLWIVWVESRKDGDGKSRLHQVGETFFCHEKDGALVIPPDAQRLMHRRHPRAMSVKAVEWLGKKPDHLFKCGARTEEEAEEQSRQANALGDIAMSLLADTEPAPKPTIRDLCAPAEGPIKILGPAKLEDAEA